MPEIPDAHSLFFRLVSETLKNRRNSVNTAWKRRDHNPKLCDVCRLFIISVCLSAACRAIGEIPVQTTATAACSHIWAEMEKEIWPFCVPQLYWLRHGGGHSACFVSRGCPPQTPMLSVAPRRLPGSCHRYRVCPRLEGKSCMGVTYHPQLCAGWLVQICDAPSFGRGTHVQQDDSLASEPATHRVSCGTEILLLHWFEQEPRQRSQQCQQVCAEV